MKQKALVICPGRGTYNAAELGYLKRNGRKFRHLLDPIDNARHRAGQPTVTELDAMDAFSPSLHTLGEHAAALIFACSLTDFHSINREKFEIVAITGNSMGWYTALGLSGALNPQAAFELTNTMGSMMKDGVIGGQIVYPEVDAQWRPDLKHTKLIDAQMAEVNAIQGCEVYNSIFFGGYRVIGGNAPGLKQLSNRLPNIDDRFPMRLVNHAAFHTPLMSPVSERALELFPKEIFGPPAIPLIDGRGHIWQPYTAKPESLRDYTLHHQVIKPYDFSKAVEVGLKEFAPTRLIVLGPGATLGGAVAQVMVRHRWGDIGSKDDFLKTQTDAPYLLSMGMENQRRQVCASSG